VGVVDLQVRQAIGVGSDRGITPIVYENNLKVLAILIPTLFPVEELTTDYLMAIQDRDNNGNLNHLCLFNILLEAGEVILHILREIR